MTTILRPIHPQHIMNIVAGLKTNEVRTKVPKCKTPYKVLVYCTSIKNMPLQLYAELHHKSRGSLDFWSGKIMGEYICDKVDCHGWDYERHGRYSCFDEELQTTCLTREELNEYGEYGKPLFFEHITNFKVYSEPRSIGEFCSPCPTADCKDCKFYKTTDSSFELGAGCECTQPTLKRPPQSFCYVEEAY